MQKKFIYLCMTVALILALAACSSNKESAEPSESLTAELEVLIKASSWELDPSTIEIPKDTPVQITLEIISGMHGIEIEGTGIKLRGNQSKVVKLDAGTYEIKCNISCGTGHSKMKATLIVK